MKTVEELRAAIGKVPMEDIKGLNLAEEDFKALNVLDISATDMAIGLICSATLEWNGSYVNFRTCLSYDSEAEEIIIDEAKLMDAIRLVNPMQPPRNLRFKKGGKVL